jgi:hypothetical protein
MCDLARPVGPILGLAPPLPAQMLLPTFARSCSGAMTFLDNSCKREVRIGQITLHLTEHMCTQIKLKSIVCTDASEPFKTSDRLNVPYEA